MAIMSPELLRRIRQTAVKPTPTIPNLGNIPKINLPNLDLSKIPQGIKIPSVPNIPTPIKPMPIGRPTPIVSKPAPIVPRPAPIVSKPAPIVSKPAPIVPRPAPIVPRPAPIVSKPAPIVFRPPKSLIEERLGYDPRVDPIRPQTPPRPVSPIVSQPPKGAFVPRPRFGDDLPMRNTPSGMTNEVPESERPPLPEGVPAGGRFYYNNSGEVIYQPPMPRGNGIQAQVMPQSMNLTTGTMISNFLGPGGRQEGVPISEVYGSTTPTPQPSIGTPTAQTTTVEPIPSAPVQTVAETPAQTVAETPAQTVAETPAQTGQAISSPTMSDEGAPFVSGATRIEAGLDPLSRQLLFGLDGKGGFIPGAFRAAEKTFFDEQGNPIVIPELVAGFSPEQQAAFELAAQTGTQQPFIEQAMGAYGKGLGALTAGLGEAERSQLGAVADVARGVGAEQALRGAGLRGLLGSLGEAGQIARGATDVFGRSLSDVEGLQRGATGQFGARTAGIAGRGISDVGRFERGLQDPEALLRGTLGGYDPRMTQAFYDPFEQQVVQQTIRDVMERGEQADIAARASDIARGGESAFGSRARLMAGERERALGRGLGEAISGIRSAGFQRAQQAGMGEFARQLEAQRQAASGLTGLAGQRLGAGQQLTGMLRGLSGEQLAAQQALASGLGSIAGQRLGAQQQLGQTLAGYGSTQQQALSQAGQQALGAQQALAGARSGLAGLQQQIAGQLQAGQFGAGQALAGLGQQAQAAQQADISQLLGVGAQQQQQQQAILDAQRRAALQAQQAPLAQYQSLLPFVQAVPAGQQQLTTTFAPPPSPLQAGLGVGLAGLGALGQFMNQPQSRTI